MKTRIAHLVPVVKFLLQKIVKPNKIKVSIAWTEMQDEDKIPDFANRYLSFSLMNHSAVLGAFFCLSGPGGNLLHLLYQETGPGIDTNPVSTN